MPDAAAIAAGIRQLMLTRWPGRFRPIELRDDVPLGESGLGLDSLEVVEILFACEERWETRLTEELLEQVPLTIGRIVLELVAA